KRIGIPHFGRLRQTTQTDRLQFLWNVCSPLSRWHRPCVSHLFQDIQKGVSVERPLSRQQLVEHHPQRMDIHLWPQLTCLARRRLRGHVERRSQNGAAGRPQATIQTPGQAKVRDSRAKLSERTPLLPWVLAAISR